MDLSTVLRALEVAGLSGVRPSWVLGATAIAAALGYVVFPPGMEFLGTWPGAGALLLFAVIEHLAERDTDMVQIFGAVQLGTSVATALLSTSALSRATGIAPPWALSAGAVVLALATIGLRRKLKLKLIELSANVATPAKWMARLEEGGLLLAGALVIFAPLLLLVGIALLAIAGVFGWLSLNALDRLRRCPCPACGCSVRREAQRCRGCAAALQPEVKLSLPPTMGERITGLLERGDELGAESLGRRPDPSGRIHGNAWTNSRQRAGRIHGAVRTNSRNDLDDSRFLRMFLPADAFRAAHDALQRTPPRVDGGGGGRRRSRARRHGSASGGEDDAGPRPRGGARGHVPLSRRSGDALRC
jgi:hypothetical protein